MISLEPAIFIAFLNLRIWVSTVRNSTNIPCPQTALSSCSLLYTLPGFSRKNFNNLYSVGPRWILFLLLITLCSLVLSSISSNSIFESANADVALLKSALILAINSEFCNYPFLDGIGCLDHTNMILVFSLIFWVFF